MHSNTHSMLAPTSRVSVPPQPKRLAMCVIPLFAAPALHTTITAPHPPASAPLPARDTSAPTTQSAPPRLARVPFLRTVPRTILPSLRSPSRHHPTHERKRQHTILNSLQAGSLGCAPTPNQYFAREVSSLISLIGFPSPEGGGLGMGSYVPIFTKPPPP